MVCTWPRNCDLVAALELGPHLVDQFAHLAATLARSVPCTLTNTSSAGAML
jgi:hypothetical protein